MIFSLAGMLYMFSIKNTGIRSGQMEVEIRGTDKARYMPAESVEITAVIRNLTEKKADGFSLEIQVYHLEQMVFSNHKDLNFKASEERSISLEWQVPNTDYQGYLICLALTDRRGNCVARDTVGVDVSSAWLKFPRYGYLCNYGESEDTFEKIDQMNRYHINGIEYYDWHGCIMNQYPQRLRISLLLYGRTGQGGKYMEIL